MQNIMKSTEETIAIIDYQMGNIGSIRKMLSKLGYDSVVSNSVNELEKYSKFILPGVGNFQNGAKKLHDLNIYNFLKNLKDEDNKYLLGICLGMQLLFEGSEEGNDSMKGLGLIKGRVNKFIDLQDGSKIPHMGWNFVEIISNENILKHLEEESRFYFVHSFFGEPANPKNTLTTTVYGGKVFCSSVFDKNIFGTQFHPEKSHKFGFSFLKGFCEL